ncbi:hypothetical protein [Bacillus sp. M6-12]|uniref:hypothetical protein n=1 Tax=Bacillus sp. M6-12 TaxID=2054166 RepID=UPI0015E13902|nr:hypothetical protein [Bacillus sp. M6-12]
MDYPNQNVINNANLQNEGMTDLQQGFIEIFGQPEAESSISLDSDRINKKNNFPANNR